VILHQSSAQTIIEAINQRGWTAFEWRSGPRIIKDPEARRITEVNPATKSFKTYIAFMGAANPDQCFAITPPADLTNYRFEHLLGYPVIHVEWSGPAAEGATETIETWVAPALGCLPLKQTIQKLDWAGNPLCQQITIAERVIPGEPDARLFAIPSRWTEVPSNSFALDSSEPACKPVFFPLARPL
jgi:hypothetical protein